MACGTERDESAIPCAYLAQIWRSPGFLIYCCKGVMVVKITSVSRWLVILVSVAGPFVMGPGHLAAVGTVLLHGYTAQQETTSPSTFVYVANGSSTTVSVIRSSDDTVISTVEVGGQPLSLAVTPDGKKIYAGVFSRGVLAIQASDNAIKTVIKTRSAGWDCPDTLAVTPDGSRLLVLDTQPVDGVRGTVSVIRTSDDRVSATCEIGIICLL